MTMQGTAAHRRPSLPRFDGRTAFVTGAGSGIGRATAIRLAAEGASLFVADLDDRGLKDTAARCAEHGADVVAKALDVSDEASVGAAVEECTGRFGRLDVLCNAAGVVVIDHLEKTTTEQFRLLVDVNLLGIFLTTRAAIGHLVETKGNVVNISSTAAGEGLGLAAAYGATKGGVSSFSRSVAAEFAARGVRCNAIVPGWIAPARMAGERVPTTVRLSVTGRHEPIVGTPPLARIASVIAMVASDEGAHLNGTEIRVDGGWLTTLEPDR